MHSLLFRINVNGELTDDSISSRIRLSEWAEGIPTYGRR
jgi:hypothetical protein